MNTNHDEPGFDRTPEGEAMAALLRRYAPPPSSSARGAAEVLGRLRRRPAGRRVALWRWLVPATGAAAAVLVVVLAAWPDDSRGPAPVPAPAVTPAAQDTPTVQRGAPQPALSARLRGTSGNGWRLDAGLKDGLRVGDRLRGPGGTVAEVVAAGIFDSRVRVSGEAARGQLFFVQDLTPAQERAARLATLGGDAGALLDFGAVFDPMPMSEARLAGLADGRALVVTEVIASVLRDFEGQPEPTLAARLGLRAGDVVLAVNGMPVRDLAGLYAALEYTRGGRVSVAVLRGSATLELSAK
ncbi:MAG: PDZ domain-containing protein [Planctomycetes bacterium]|nr:PDZ domain-containing protein [Planctomycetota bacterium]MCL4731448.1 PDZ domain-containing protein [Planctomycetota bacterium]